jgi:Tfp pilus assembly protein PilF
MNLDNDEKAEEYLLKTLDADPENDIVLKQLSYMAYINHDFDKCSYFIKRVPKNSIFDKKSNTNIKYK